MRRRVAAVSVTLMAALIYYASILEREERQAVPIEPDSHVADDRAQLAGELELAEAALDPGESDDSNTGDVDLSDSEADEAVFLADFEMRPPPTSLLPPNQLSEVRFTAYVASLFESEPVDEDWAFPMEARAYDVLASQGTRVIAVAIHCRTTMCRIEAAVDASNLNGMNYSGYMKALQPLWMNDSRLTAFIDTHRGGPPSPGSRAVNVEIWQAYLVGPEVEQLMDEEVRSWARERPSIRQRLESRR